MKVFAHYHDGLCDNVCGKILDGHLGINSSKKYLTNNLFKSKIIGAKPER